MVSRSKNALALYVHLPWCIKKCPYCDFNSHVANHRESSASGLPEKSYLSALIDDLEQELLIIQRPIILRSIFFGGGTPSLLSAAFYRDLLIEVATRCQFADDIEISLEANPGTVDEANFIGYRQAGINRLSIGVQSFSNQSLKKLGRIHDVSQAHRAFKVAREAGFENINIDLMHGLPEQSVADAVSDLERAFSLQPEHLSWYQLTIEPNTIFYKQPPSLPHEDALISIADRGLALIEEQGYAQYEVSAYAKAGKQSVHNHNYWTFGDYIGIGAGAHGKLTQDNTSIRRRKRRIPVDYIGARSKLADEQVIALDELPLEFMMNALRLRAGFSLSLFEQRTALSSEIILPKLNGLVDDELISFKHEHVQPTALGWRYLNDVVARFAD